MGFTLEMTVLSAVAVAAFATGVWIIRSRIRRAGDPEARRRALIEAMGRIIEGTVTDYQDGLVYYRWSWRGVDYESSQDVSTFADQLPQPKAIIGPVSVKFLSNVPSNSIIISEKWSGFRGSPRPENSE